MKKVFEGFMRMKLNETTSKPYYDFEGKWYSDLSVLKDYDGPFIWSPRDSGTWLILMDSDMFKDYTEEGIEKFKEEFEEGKDWETVKLCYEYSDARYFYCDGIREFSEISQGRAIVKYRSMVNQLLNAMS